jgi:hypothetical protein
MSCRRICRELVELVRFGELDRRSAPHLDHLAACRACRDEVGFDRALVQQLRVALAERVDAAAPSPQAWFMILERAKSPDAGLRGWLRGHPALLTARLRTATAVSATALAFVIAAGTQVSVSHPGAVEPEWDQSGAGEAFEQGPLQSRARPELWSLRSLPVNYRAPARPRDPETAFMSDATQVLPYAEQEAVDPVAPDDTGSTLVIADQVRGPRLADDAPDAPTAAVGEPDEPDEPMSPGRPS